MNPDDMIQKLEDQGYQFDIGNTGMNIECRIWSWPHVIGRYRVDKFTTIEDMLSGAMKDAGIK